MYQFYKYYLFNLFKTIPVDFKLELGKADHLANKLRFCYYSDSSCIPTEQGSRLLHAILNNSWEHTTYFKSLN